MSVISAFKMDGLGNDFIIIDRRKNLINLSKDEIIKLSDRNKIGFDQIIFIEKEVNNIVPLTIFNSDGNEISACGNGSRCIAYLLGKEKNKDKVVLKTNNRLLNANIVGNLSVEINMGKPMFDWDKIPLSKKLDYKNIDLKIGDNEFKEGFCLNVGNPHIVFFVKDCFNYDLKKIGPKIESHEIFPEKCNVTFAQINNKKNISVNVWERGAGLTKACGTAACATVVASNIKKLTDNNVDVKFKEGILNIKFDKQQNIFMKGPVSEIKNIEINI
jgi:diaminopimelate epimerase